MKWLQYGCQQKLVNDYIMILLCFQHFQFYSIDLEMHFTINLAFVNYFDDMIEELGIPVSQNWTTQEQILSLSLETFEINPTLLNTPKTL